jgi:hypothetical protein
MDNESDVAASPEEHVDDYMIFGYYRSLLIWQVF